MQHTQLELMMSKITYHSSVAHTQQTKIHFSI
jgi:hypothetical protein